MGKHTALFESGIKGRKLCWRYLAVTDFNDLTQWAHDVRMTSYQRRFDVMTSKAFIDFGYFATFLLISNLS